VGLSGVSGIRLATRSPLTWRGFVASGHRLLRANFLRNAVSAYTIHIMPDDKSIPSSASPGPIGVGLCSERVRCMRELPKGGTDGASRLDE
jgi:hypothetical protein